MNELDLNQKNKYNNKDNNAFYKNNNNNKKLHNSKNNNKNIKFIYPFMKYY